jgi:hypothetical protein
LALSFPKAGFRLWLARRLFALVSSPTVVQGLVDSAPQPDPVTGLYNKENEDHPMSEYGLRLSPAKETQWEAKYNPVITFRYAFLSHVLIFNLPHLSVPNTNRTMPCASVSGASI